MSQATHETLGERPVILTINGGSSSIKFAVFDSADASHRVFSGQVERIGTPGAQLVATRNAPEQEDVRSMDAASFTHAADHIVNYLRERLGAATLTGIGHRVVHGGVHLLAHQLVTQGVIDELRRTQPLDLAHLPREIALIESFRSAYPSVPQVACFDTAFHRDLPRVAQLLPIPHHYYDEGIRRFGFHGLSYTYLLQKLAVIGGPNVANGRIILAHLGSGASMAAVKGGKPIDTTMAFTPTAGLVMGTRPGDLDPGLLVYLMRVEKMTPDQMDEFISHHCGLIGVSGTSSDMRDLILRRASDTRAADAVELFCYQARKSIGALTATLGGLDTLVFAGGIGELSSEVRALICDGLAFLGLELEPTANREGRELISTWSSRVAVRIIPTDEESVISQAVRAVTMSTHGTIS